MLNLKTLQTVSPLLCLLNSDAKVVISLGGMVGLGKTAFSKDLIES